MFGPRQLARGNTDAETQSPELRGVLARRLEAN